MSNFNTVEDILDFAIDKEDEAARFYSDLARDMDRPWMAQIFRGFASEEMKHKATLQQVKRGSKGLPATQKVQDLKIADYLVETPMGAQMDYQDALTLAMQREKASFRLYNDLAGMVEDTQLKDTFLALAQEEAKHKLRIEIEYDDVVLTDN